VRADAAQVRQVLVNLVMNAAEAIGDAPGTIRVATGVADVAGPGEGDPLPPAPGRYLRLAVADSGPGIPPDILPRVFDPFFSTKFAGRGLGLSAVLGIMRTHGGAIHLDTAVGRGTTVEVLWPVVAGPAAGPAPTRPAQPGVVANRALVVDDEMYVRELTASTLQDLGYEPLVAGDAAAALDLFRRHRGEVRVAVIDVVLPGTSGEELLGQLRALAPHLPVVMVSGLAGRRGADAAAAPTEFLQKPFHPEELAVAVARVAPR
jgi:CheY-like chemotaxis protein